MSVIFDRNRKSLPVIFATQFVNEHNSLVLFILKQRSQMLTPLLYIYFFYFVLRLLLTYASSSRKSMIMILYNSNNVI